MKPTLAIVIIAATALMINGATAKHSKYQAAAQSSGGAYWSLSQGQQPYPNPDRELYMNRSCCS
jgi:hypothetical protein